MEDAQCHFRFTCFVSGFYLDKTRSIDSLLLGSTILNIFQITDVVDDPVTRTAALLSLICALMSLSYGCMYIVRFGMMRNMFHASRWAEVSILLIASRQHVFTFTQEAQKMKTSILWNVWVLLAMPVVWMSWWVPQKEKVSSLFTH